MRKCLIAFLIIVQTVFAQSDPCKDETQKADAFFEMCLKFDKESAGYMDCVKMFMEQKAKADSVCQAAPPVPVAPAEAPEAPAPVAVPPVAAAPQPMSLEQALSGSGLSSSCVEGFSSILGKEGFSMSNFAKDLVTSVAKVKLQMKSPFGKPKDEDKTSVGLTVGCIKSLPESPAEIQSLLQNIALKAGLSFALDAAANSVASSGGDAPEMKSGGEEGVKLGVRAGFSMYKYSEEYFDPGVGMGFGAGLALKIPFSSSLGVYSELAIFYKRLYNDIYSMYEYVISVPVLLRVSPTESFYLAAGAHLDFPIMSYEEAQDVTEFRKTCDFGAAFGLGYMITPNFGIDLRGIIGITPLFEYKGSEYGSLMQFGLGTTYFF